MDKKKLFQILSLAELEPVMEISKLITDRYPVISIRPAQKTLTMIKVREPVGASLFYLGEVLCCECMVEVEGEKGFAVLAGDNFEKTTAAAVIDAALNAGVDGMEEITDRLLALEKQQTEDRAPMNAQIMKSKVNFNVMGE